MKSIVFWWKVLGQIPLNNLSCACYSIIWKYNGKEGPNVVVGLVGLVMAGSVRSPQNLSLWCIIQSSLVDALCCCWHALAYFNSGCTGACGWICNVIGIIFFLCFSLCMCESSTFTSIILSLKLFSSQWNHSLWKEKTGCLNDYIFNIKIPWQNSKYMWNKQSFCTYMTTCMHDVS